MSIHPSSIIDDGAEIGEGVNIGPFCHVGAQVKLADNVELVSHVSVAGNTHIGRNTRIFPFASIGHEPQDLKFSGEETSLRIGENCLIREGVTMNTGTRGGGSKTVVGNGCAFLANSHVAHDCILGDNIILSNNTMLAGHCIIDDNVIFGGGSAIHQFSRVGRNAFIGGMTGVEGDVIPYGIMRGERGYLIGLNVIGMKRTGFERKSILAATNAFKRIFVGNATIKAGVEDVANEADDPLVQQIIGFIKAAKDRKICKPNPSQK